MNDARHPGRPELPRGHARSHPRKRATPNSVHDHAARNAVAAHEHNRATHSLGLGPGDDERKRLRTQLQDTFRKLELVHDVMILCERRCADQNADDDRTIAAVLKQCAINPLSRQLTELTRVIEALGGQTSYSEDRQDDDERRSVTS